jgi:NADH-quinone oxidoreductase subunit L
MGSVLLLMILLPLAGSVLNGLLLRTPYPKRAGVIASLAACGAFVCAVVLWGNLLSAGTPFEIELDWFKAGVLDMKWGFRFDALTAVMSLIVTGIGTLIHVYSIGYMSEERTPYRYFAYLNLFLFSMLSLITANNLVGMFVGWEGVGLCSYLLIGYWYQDIDKANAGIKAFLVNRIGDAGFLIGMFLCFDLFSSLKFSTIGQVLAQPGSLDLVKLNWAAFFLFVGAMGKSAQIPLYVWLPDAMAGPTPVSALIHAATMVTAGVYLVARMNALFTLAENTRLFIGFIGGATALMAALIATSQRDIKKVLAYSTVSQLGLMFLAAGAGAYVAAVFHLMTHAFFKALLFLGSGSVIHALEGEQDIHNMGGLRAKLPITFWTFAIGTVAIAGVPPLAGFFSKDLILYSTLGVKDYGVWLWLLGSVASLLTAFYMTRLFVLVFLGEYRGHAHPHESPPVMAVPLIVLAIGSCLAGFLQMPEAFHLFPGILGQFLSPVIPQVAEGAEGGRMLSEFGAMGLATAAAIAGIAVGFYLFSDLGRAASVGKVFRPFAYLFENKFFVDELYGLLFVRPFLGLANFLARFFDPRIVDGAVLLPSRICRAGATVLSFVQGGSVQFYLVVMLMGALAVVWVSLKGTMVF